MEALHPAITCNCAIEVHFSILCNRIRVAIHLNSGFYIHGFNDHRKQGTREFQDTIPAGNIVCSIAQVNRQLVRVTVNLYGQFLCNETGEVATVIVSINDMFVSWEKLPTSPVCNCSLCMSNYSFPSNQELEGGYAYGAVNYFKVDTVTNVICLSSANVTLQYNHSDFFPKTVFPSSGEISGGTNITISGIFATELIVRR